MKINWIHENETRLNCALEWHNKQNWNEVKNKNIKLNEYNSNKL